MHRVSPSPIPCAKLNQAFKVFPVPTIADVLISYGKATHNENLKEKFATTNVKGYGHNSYIVWCRNLCTGL